MIDLVEEDKEVKMGKTKNKRRKKQHKKLLFQNKSPLNSRKERNQLAVQVKMQKQLKI